MYIYIHIFIHYINHTLHISHRFIENIHISGLRSCVGWISVNLSYAGNGGFGAVVPWEKHGISMGFLWKNGGKTMENPSLKGDFYVISMGFRDFYGISNFLGLQWGSFMKISPGLP
jgi:hypothetical protein